MEYINRNIEKDIKKRFFKGKAIIIYGPRQSDNYIINKENYENFLMKIK